MYSYHHGVRTQGRKEGKRKRRQGGNKGISLLFMTELTSIFLVLVKALDFFPISVEFGV